MNRFLQVNEKKYQFAINYKDNDNLRKSFNELTQRTYGFSLEGWYQYGYWKEQYMPYSLLDGDKVIANVSVNIMDFLVCDEKKRYIQIGTVMTDKGYRGQGLSRVLMEKVLSDWENKCDLIYLYANDSVTDFYPKFGFKESNEYQFSKSIVKKENNIIPKQLEVSNTDDRNLIFQTVSNTFPHSKVSMVNNPSLVMFYCTSFMKDSVYYINDYDVVAIADYHNDTLYLHDVFSTRDIPLDNIIDALAKEQTKKVVLGFTPKDTSSYEINLLKEEDTTFFVKAIKENLLKNSRLPILSRA